ncbi:MAG: beta-lactamase family protein, partial [Clostridia bacterium]|nr:beta-lactamase family protein [Clostridia bacterium]
MDFTRLDAFLDRITAWRIPGNDCMVYKDGKIVHRHFSGYADVEKGKRIDGSETYNMWSCSKPITCAAALTLLERGDFLLTDPIEKYLPEFADVKVKARDENGNEILVKATKKITVRDLFTMSSGYSYDLTKSTIADVRKRTGGRCPTREVVRSFADIPLECEPGDCWVYGIGHDILACLVEVIVGERFADYVKRVIFDPLEMHDSTFGEATEDMKARMARQYSYDE